MSIEIIVVTSLSLIVFFAFGVYCGVRGVNENLRECQRIIETLDKEKGDLIEELTELKKKIEV